MFRLKNETFYFLSTKIFKQNFSKTSKNLYDVLNITPKATQQDIKTSYYKLSKLYHPDVNKDNADAAENFRLITEAYEVLGNYRLRKLYDRGIIHTAGKHYSHHASSEKKTEAYDDTADHEHDDPTTKFYKSRLRRQNAPTGHKIYDFDEWTSQHYSNTFASAKKGRERYDFKMNRNSADQENKVASNLSLIFIGAVGVFIFLAELSRQSNLDLIRINKAKQKEAMELIRKEKISERRNE